MFSKLSLCLLVIATVLVLVQYSSSEKSRGLSRLVGQQPLLFGRRGVNPNMNSLFFGKRAAEQSVLEDILMEKCTNVLATCQRIMQGRDSVSEEIWYV
ncbi:hypothetical protein FSP39_024946 [Pinctada imbricata]|uniref:Uncharacterized protein n=1 Tax=Pinctada imbricata TaxID=66713 RepID=A0AA88YJD9_PINIB|nr:hypothetical protein FSP39_024946 [Pinctada imbricata]